MGSGEEAKGKNRLYVGSVLEAAISEALVTVVFSVQEQVYLFLGTEEVTETHFSMSQPWCEVQVGLPSGLCFFCCIRPPFPKPHPHPSQPGLPPHCGAALCLGGIKHAKFQGSAANCLSKRAFLLLAVGTEGPVGVASSASWVG